VGSPFGGTDNRFKDSVQFAINLMIPNADDTITGTVKALTIEMPFKGMLSAVHLNNQASTAAFEVDDIVEKRRLATEVQAQRA
jgi:hypothetical protein